VAAPQVAYLLARLGFTLRRRLVPQVAPIGIDTEDFGLPMEYNPLCTILK
jgi:hypothetical protein